MENNFRVGFSLSIFFVLIWLLYLTPDPMYFAQDPDGGFFIAGAWQERVNGSLMQVDILSSYGPLSFKLRTISQLIFGDKPLAEIALVIAGYTLSYAIFFILVYRISGNQNIAFLLLVVGVICLPRYYKFLVVLIPVVACLTAWLHVSAPSLLNALALGGAISLAILFRHDYGFFASCVAIVSLIYAPSGGKSRFVYSIVALTSALLGITPWAYQLIYHNALSRHLSDIIAVTRTYNSGLGLPHPLLKPSDVKNFLAFAIVYSFPIAAAILTYRYRDKHDRIGKAQAAVVITTAGVFLIQSMHRADYGHLIQSISAVLMAGALMWRMARSTLDNCLVIILLIACGLSGLINFQYPLRSPAYVISVLQNSFMDRSSWRHHIIESRPESSVASVLRLLDCLPSNRSISVFPFMPQLSYLGEKVFAGDTLLVAPGYFSSTEDQERMIRGLVRDQPLIVLWDETFVFDGSPDRNPKNTHGLLFEWVRKNMQADGNTGGYQIYVNPRENNENVTACWRS